MGSFGEVPSSWQVMSSAGMPGCSVTAPALHLKDPCRRPLIYQTGWEGRRILPRSARHTCQSTNVYKPFFFPSYIFPWDFFFSNQQKVSLLCLAFLSMQNCHASNYQQLSLFLPRFICISAAEFLYRLHH